MNSPVGSRIGVIYGGDSATKTLKVLGYGVRAEDEVPNADAGGWMADVLREGKMTNPCMVLDNGDRVYGCECWWGPEDAVKARIALHENGGCTVVLVRIADMRRAALQSHRDERGANG